MAELQENLCTFYTSDYHLEMIMLPYINKNLKNNKDVYVFTQDNLDESINHLVKNVNIEDNIKKKILNINWKNENEDKYNSLIENNNESIIFVKGNEDYIKKVNKNLNQIKNYRNIEIIDCYSLDEVGDKVNIITKNYENILMTEGKRKCDL